MTSKISPNSNPKVSILVPIYNVSDYIERCALSLFNQTFSDIEYIFVNDATPDNSIELLQKVLTQFPQRSNQVKIIHHDTNKGVAAARNTAIGACNGNYIAMVDSDDYINPLMIELLYNKACAEDADIVVSDILYEYSDKSIPFYDIVYDTIEENRYSILVNNKVCHALWNKLIRRSLYLHYDCTIPLGLNYGEDRHALVRFFYFAQKIVKVNEALYHYVQYNSNAITKRKERMHFENVLTFWKLLDEFLLKQKEFEKYRNALELTRVQNKVRLMIDTHSSKLRKEYAYMFSEEEKRHINYFKRGEKLMLLLVRYRQFWLTQLFHNLLLIKHKKPIYSF
jgi:glycosyltransferase involved in cell wall biosynthesis